MEYANKILGQMENFFLKIQHMSMKFKGKNQWTGRQKNRILFPALPTSGFPALSIWGSTSEPQFPWQLNDLVDLTAS